MQKYLSTIKFFSKAGMTHSFFMTIIFPLCVLCGLIFISSCIPNRSNSNIDLAEYPSSKYLTATGIGQSEPEAKNNAASELSKIFESSVKSSTMDRVKSVIDPSGNEKYSQDIESKVAVTSHVKLTGLTVAKTWNKDSQYYALAVLEKLQARDNWGREIEALDNKIDGEIASLKTTKGKFLQYRGMKKIISLWIEREVLVSRIRVLGFNYSGSKDYGIEGIFKKLPMTKNEILIFIKMSGEDASKIHDGMADILGKNDLKITGSEDHADLIITGDVKVAPVKLDNKGWEFARASVSLKITDSITNLQVGEISADKREGHLSYNEAVNKALKGVMDDISIQLVEYINNPSEQ